MSLPWYMYPPDSPGGGYGSVEPQCAGSGHCYSKPDTNIAIPAGTPITTWDSGVITEVRDRGLYDGGFGVTMKLDHPINSLAQYASFNFIGSSNVSVGQRVSAGQQVATAGSSYGTLFALGLGPSPGWGQVCPACSGNPLTDPRPILAALRAGRTPQGSALASGSVGGQDLMVTLGLTTAQTSPTQCAPWDLPCALQEIIQSDYMQRAGILFFGLMLALVGVIVLFVGHGGVQKTMKAAAMVPK